MKKINFIFISVTFSSFLILFSLIIVFLFFGNNLFFLSIFFNLLIFVTLNFNLLFYEFSFSTFLDQLQILSIWAHQRVISLEINFNTFEIIICSHFMIRRFLFAVFINFDFIIILFL